MSETPEIHADPTYEAPRILVLGRLDELTTGAGLPVPDLDLAGSA